MTMKLEFILVCVYCTIAMAETVEIIDPVQSTANLPKECGIQIDDFVTRYEIELTNRDTVLELFLVEITKNVPRWVTVNILYPRILRQGENTLVSIYTSPTAAVYKKGKEIEAVIFAEARKITVKLIPDYWNKTEDRRQRKKCHLEFIKRNKEGRVVSSTVNSQCDYLKKVK